MNASPPFKPGDHVYSERDGGLFYHHAIYEGNGIFIALGPGKNDEYRTVFREPWHHFYEGGKIGVVAYAKCFPPEHTLALARSYLGKPSFDVLDNNCEHFARWCKTGLKRSYQADLARGVTTAAGLTAAATFGGTAALAASPAAIWSFALAPTVAVGMGLQEAFADDPTLRPSEREARDAARAGALMGGAAGTFASVAAVAMAGGSKGVLAGLKVLGATVGYGVKTGAAIACALPALAAATMAYAYYQAESAANPWASPTRTTLT